MNTFLLKFEKHVSLSPPEVAKVLGYSRSSYYQLRKTKSTPLITRRLVEVIMRLPQREFQRVIEEYLDDDL